MHVFNIVESFAEWQLAQWSIGASIAISLFIVFSFALVFDVTLYFRQLRV